MAHLLTSQPNTPGLLRSRVPASLPIPIAFSRRLAVLPSSSRIPFKHQSCSHSSSSVLPAAQFRSSRLGFLCPCPAASSSPAAAEDPPPDATTMAIFAATSWEQLYDLHYTTTTAAPSHQHCYSYLTSLAELLPELDQRPPTAVAAAGIGGSSHSSSSSSFHGAGVDLDSGWEALRAAGKVVSWNQLTALRGFIRDLVKCVQSHLRSFNARQLVDLLQAVCQLSHPPPRWLLAWQEAVVCHLKGLSCRELCTAAEVMLLHDVQPSRPWAGLWCVAMEKHLAQCSQQQLSLASLAVAHWGIRPTPGWVTPFAQSLSTHLPGMSAAEVLVCMSAAVLMGLKLGPEQQQLLCDVTLAHLREGVSDGGSSGGDRSRGLLAQAAQRREEWPAARLLQLLRGCLLLGWQPSVDWLAAWVAAVQHGMRATTTTSSSSSNKSSSSTGSVDSSSSSAGSSGWDLAAAASALTALASADAAADALAGTAAVDTGTASSNSSSNSSSSSFLDFVVQYTRPLIEGQASAGALVELLWGFEALQYTPPDEYLDLLLDEAAVKLQGSSIALLKQHYPHCAVSSTTSSSSTSSSSRASDANTLTEGGEGSHFSVADWGGSAAEGGSTDSRQGGSSSSSSRVEDQSGSRSDSEGEQMWSTLEAGACKPSANITLARRHLESSWSMKVREHPPAAGQGQGPDPASSSSSSSSGKGPGVPGRSPLSNARTPPASGSSGVNGRAAGARIPLQPPSAAAIAASSGVVRQVLGLLSAVAAMRLPVEGCWVGDVLESLRGHFAGVGLPEFQRLLLLRELLRGSPEPEWVDELLTECTVSPRQLTDPLDQLHLLSLLAVSSTRPNNLWWQQFLSTCQDSLSSRYTPAQQVMLLALLADLGGRPPQSWLAAHEVSLLAAQGGVGAGGQALGLEGWLLLLQCYGKLMYKPSHAFESVFECHAHGLLQSMSAGELSSLVGSVARLQLPLSPMLEDGITHRLDKVLDSASAAELEGLVEGLLLLEVQLPSPTLHTLCAMVQPHLGSFAAPATCCLLQLLSREGEFPPSPLWMDQALAGLQPQLRTLEALPALQLLGSLKEFHARPPAKFMAEFQSRLAHLTKKLDAMGVATMLQGLVACGLNPSLEVQRGVARHIKKGLARASQGMGGTPVWILLDSLLRSGDRLAAASEGSRAGAAGTFAGTPASGAVGVAFGTSGVICSELLDELLLQVAGQLSADAVSSSRMCRHLLPALAAAFVPGGCWAPPGFNYTPSPGFCDALCWAMLEFHRVQAQVSTDGGAELGQGDGAGELSGLIWLGLLTRFGDMTGFRPEPAWIQAASEAVMSSWDEAAADGSSSSGGAVLALPAATLGTEVWQVAPASQFTAWLGAVGRLRHQPCHVPGWPAQVLDRLQTLLGELNGHELSVALLGLAHQQQLAEVAAAGVLPPDGSSGGSSDTLAALAAVKPRLLSAAEAASLQHLPGMDAADLATVAHALQQLDHTPAPAWVEAWAAAVAVQLPGCSAAAAVLQVAALAGFCARPSADLLEGLVSRCQAGIGQLELQELLGFARALCVLGYRPEAVLLRDIVRAGQAAVARGKGQGNDAEQQMRAHMVVELQHLSVLLAG